ncbi:MAG: response regulator [Vicinamibacterales bacterium]
MCAHETSERCSILIVEDEPDLQDLLRLTLEAEGYRVAAVPDGRRALTHLRSTASTCAIVLDLALPVMSGRRFRHAQLRDRSLAWLPVVVVSGSLDAAREARDLQAQAFVRKPIDPGELRAALYRVCHPTTPVPQRRSGTDRQRDAQ